jgi:hypothetical protein
MLSSPITHILPVSSVRRTRLLPIPGRILVRKGQKVDATDVVAEAILAPEHIMLDVARSLGLRGNKADRRVVRKVGEDVLEGDIIAGPVGISKRVCRAPRDGRIVIIGEGQVLLQVGGRPFELKAGIPGVVTEFIEDRGVEIETVGALIQCVWGNGRIDSGLLQVLANAPADELSYDRLDVSQRGAVLLGGTLQDGRVLQNAAEIPIRGLILSSMASTLISIAEKMPYPILLTDGFGKIPMNSAAYKLLSTNERREISLNAEAWDRLAGIRPEMVIALPDPGRLPLSAETDVFRPGQQVLVASATRKGTVGTLVTLHSGLVALPSGIKAYAADVRLESGETMLFPLANLEVLK